MQRSLALAELQALFWRALNGPPDLALHAAVESGGALTAADRLGIYTGMYGARLHDVLAEDFEHVAAALGDDRFGDAVRAYLTAHPSDRPSVRHLGRHFASFLAAEPPRGAPPWLADLAALEWARVEVFDAPDSDPVDQEQLRSIAGGDWAGLVLVPIPALAVLESAWPLHVIWRDGGGVDPAPTSLRIWRQASIVYHAPMDGLEREAFARLQAGQCFGEVCETFSHVEGAAAAAEAGAMLARWLEDGLIAELR